MIGQQHCEQPALNLKRVQKDPILPDIVECECAIIRHKGHNACIKAYSVTRIRSEYVRLRQSIIWRTSERDCNTISLFMSAESHPCHITEIPHSAVHFPICTISCATATNPLIQ